MGDTVYIENDGALFRGPSRGFPTHVWDARQGFFIPYGGEVPKPIDWGTVIDQTAADAIMDD